MNIFYFIFSHIEEVCCASLCQMIIGTSYRLSCGIPDKANEPGLCMGSQPQIMQKAHLFSHFLTFPTVLYNKTNDLSSKFVDIF